MKFLCLLRSLLLSMRKSFLLKFVPSRYWLMVIFKLLVRFSISLISLRSKYNIYFFVFRYTFGRAVRGTVTAKACLFRRFFFRFRRFRRRPSPQTQSPCKTLVQPVCMINERFCLIGIQTNCYYSFKYDG